MNLLLDTNVIIDFLGRKEPYFDSAKRIIAAGYFGDATLWMSAGSAKDAFYVLSHYVEPTKVQQAILELLSEVAPVSLTADDLARAARLEWTDYEDCLIAISAEKAQARYIITRDKTGFERSMVPTRTPDEWLAEMTAEGITFDEISLD